MNVGFMCFSFTSFVEIAFWFLSNNKKRDTFLLKGRVFYALYKLQ